ncbi:MAG TPA: SGNH/GDSL hydrolase family protein [Polyangiaceae bacterium]|nr:SGNH/GDSL hydrolase family protein [Polyangiaceae bacterium]
MPPSKVVMLGDSYLDPNYGNVGNNIFADAQAAGSLAANTTYRHYYLAGAAMNNGAGLLNIPYQYDSGAKTDLAVSNPADIDVIVMDGGGNDVLIDQQSCLTAGPTQAACANAITATVARTKSLWQEMAKDGVKHIVYFFYPHLDPAGGGLLPTPSPYVNTTDDYSAPLYQQICCGSTFTPTASANTCSGNAPGTDCVYIDTRPAYDGHQTDWILSDHVHPNAMGSKVIADLVWKAMTAHCIAQ